MFTELGVDIFNIMSIKRYLNFTLRCEQTSIMFYCNLKQYRNFLEKSNFKNYFKDGKIPLGLEGAAGFVVIFLGSCLLFCIFVCLFLLRVLLLFVGVFSLADWLVGLFEIFLGKWGWGGAFMFIFILSGRKMLNKSAARNMKNLAEIKTH